MTAVYPSWLLRSSLAPHSGRTALGTAIRSRLLPLQSIQLPSGDSHLGLDLALLMIATQELAGLVAAHSTGKYRP